MLFPIGTLLAATAGIQALLAVVRADGTPAAALPGLPSFDGFTDLIGLPEVRELEQRFGGRLNAGNGRDTIRAALLGGAAGRAEYLRAEG